MARRNKHIRLSAEERERLAERKSREGFEEMPYGAWLMRVLDERTERDN